MRIDFFFFNLKSVVSLSKESKTQGSMFWKVQWRKGKWDIIKALGPVSLMTRWRNTPRAAGGTGMSLVGQGDSVLYVLFGLTSVEILRKAELCHQLRVPQLSRSLQLSSQMDQGWWMGKQGRQAACLTLVCKKSGNAWYHRAGQKKSSVFHML